MSLEPGTRLGPYEIQSIAGAGGMGEVYRARDTRLDRTVAVKVLPSHLSSSPEVRERFEREARTVSQFSHPNICAVYDVGREGDTGFVVMEYLQGEPLTERLAKGPLPLDQALRIGAQLAEALDQAHRHGIVHRDVKPGNVMLTRAGAKLLDFGLAKAAPSLVQAAGPGSGHTALATEAHLTGAGTILGTVQYMAPEQLEGRDADARTDIFALGAVLYELVSGRKAFTATSQAALISAIMKDEPPRLSSVQSLSPPLLDRLIHACLAKNPDDRVQTAHDVLLQLRWIGEGSQIGLAVPADAVPRRAAARTWLAWAAAVLVTLAAAWLGLSRSGPSVAERAPSVVRSTILLPERVSLNNAVISPAGDRLVFSGLDASGRPQLWVRRLDADAASPVAGTEGAILPFWSPDGHDVGFFTDQAMKRIEVSGGVPVSLHDISGVGGAWAASGDILFSGASGPILRVAATGGPATPVTALDTARGETAHRYPFMLPDGRHFLFLAMKPAGSPRDPANRVCVGSLDGGPVKPLFPANFNAQYADGYVLFTRGGDAGGSLLAQAFDSARLEVTGTPVTVADHTAPYGSFAGLGSSSVSGNGMLLYDASRLLTRLQWYDRGGRPAGAFGEPGLRSEPRVSPDGTRISFSQYDPGTQTTQVWVGDLRRGVETRVTSAPGSNSSAIWSPDGTRLAYQSDRQHQADIYIRLADGSGPEQALTDEVGQRVPMAWSSDGTLIVAYDREPAGDRRVGILAVPVDGRSKRFTVVERRTDNISAAPLSPDGRWLAWDTDESGRREVYVVSFPDGKDKVQISSAGGTDAQWTRGGKELLYLSPDRKVMAVTVDTSSGFRVSSPAPLFDVPEGATGRWHASADGERFYFSIPVLKSSSVPLTLVQNWAAGIRR